MTHKKKKVMFIIDDFSIGGAERVILDIIEYVKKDTEVHVVSILGSGPRKEEFEKSATRIYCMGFGKYKLIWLVYFPVIVVKVMYLLIKIRPTTVVSSLFLADVVGMFLAWIVRIPIRVVIQHDVHAFGFLRTCIKKNITMRSASVVVAVSAAVKNFLQDELGIKEEKIIIIKNGIDADKFVLQEHCNTPPVIGFIGRLEKNKGPQYLLQAIVIGRIKHEVLIVGEGSQRITLEKYVKDQKIHNVNFLGAVDNVLEALSRMDIVVVPSEEEGFGLVALEALVVGKIVIVSNIPALLELTDTSFKSKDPYDLYRKLQKLLTNKDMLQKARKKALLWRGGNIDIYDSKKAGKKYVRILNMI